MTGSRQMRCAGIGAAIALMIGAAAMPADAQRRRGTTTMDLDPNAQGPVFGVGIGNADIVAMADRMMRDMLASPALAGRATPPQIIIDSAYFENESSQRINKNLITDRLRTNLNRASQGRFVFVGRHRADMVEEERTLKREGVVDVATTGLTQAQAGGDFRLAGNIASMDARDNRTGMVQKFTQITFEMMDLERGVIVWSNTYDIARASSDDIVYR